jgi:hypothetical protein
MTVDRTAVAAALAAKRAELDDASRCARYADVY